MPIVTTADIAAALVDTTGQAIAIISNLICPGVPDALTKKSRVVSFRWRDSSTSGYLSPVVAGFNVTPNRLKAWPVTGLTSVTQDGTDITALCTFSRFTVTRVDGQRFADNALIVINFQTGFDQYGLTGAGIVPIPYELVQAISVASAAIAETPYGNILSQKIGDVETSYANDSNGLYRAGAAIASLVADFIMPYTWRDMA